MMEHLCGQFSHVNVQDDLLFLRQLKLKFRNDFVESRTKSFIPTNTAIKVAHINNHVWFGRQHCHSYSKCFGYSGLPGDSDNGMSVYAGGKLHGNDKSHQTSINQIYGRQKPLCNGEGSSPICVSDSHKDADTKILFAAGGTGGHVYPAIAIANEVQRLEPNSSIQFVGSKDRMEWLAVPKAGYSIAAIPAAGLQRPYLSFRNLLLPFKLLLSMCLSWKILRDFRPDVVVGTGGYVSAPLCLVAALTGYPLVIQEQNAYPGITNRILSFFATLIFVAFSSAISFFPKEKCALLGNPTRLAFNRYISSAVSRRLFFPDGLITSLQTLEWLKEGEQAVLQASGDSVKVLLILGGSLGSRSINFAVAGMVIQMLESNPGRHVIWQTGVNNYDEMLSLVKEHPRLCMLGFIDQMENAFAAADLVVSRAGAITCSEILVAGKPSILVPSPNVAEDHQMKNALYMVQTGASKLLLEKELNSETLSASINEILESKELIRGMGVNALKAAAPYAAGQIASELLSIAKKRVTGTKVKSSAKVSYT